MVIIPALIKFAYNFELLSSVISLLLIIILQFIAMQISLSKTRSSAVQRGYVRCLPEATSH